MYLPKISRQWYAAAVIGITFLAMFFRLSGLSSRSFWTDEAYSYWFQQLPWHALWHDTPSYETHPPFYYSVLKLWCQRFGVTEAAMRSLSVLASVATVAALAVWPRLFERNVLLEWLGLATAALLAVNAGNVQYAQQARPYALLTLCATFMVLTSASLLGDLFRSNAQDRVKRRFAVKAAFLGLFAGVTLWLHNTSPFLILANWLGLGVALVLYSTNKRRDFSLVAAALLLALLIWSPCVPILLEETQTVASNFWPLISGEMIVWPITLVAGGQYALLPIAAISVYGLWRLWRVHKGFAAYCAITLFLPLLTVFSLSYLFRPILIARTFLWMGPIVLFLVSYGIASDAGKALSKAGVFILLLVLGGYETTLFYHAPSENYRALFHTLQTTTSANDVILVYPNELDVGLRYYQRFASHRLRYYALPRPFPDVGDTRPYLGSNKGEAEVVDADRGYIDALIAGHHKVLLVSWAKDVDSVSDVVRDELHKKRGPSMQILLDRNFAVSEFEGR